MKIISYAKHLVLVTGAIINFSDQVCYYHCVKLHWTSTAYNVHFLFFSASLETIILHSTYSAIKENGL